MRDVPTPPAAERTVVERYAYLGTLLIASAFAGPALATLLGADIAFSFFQALATALGTLAVLALVAWMVTRSRSALAKAKARAVVGILLCMAVATHIATAAKESPLSSRFVGDAVAFQVRQAAKLEDLGKRFNELTVARYLTTAALAAPDSVSAGQAELARYRALLDERHAALRTYLAEYAAFVNTLPPDDGRLGAEAAIGPSKQATESLYEALDRTQRAHADAMAAVFSWALANVGMWRLDGMQLHFQSPKGQTEFSALVFRLHRAERAVNEAVEQAQIDGIRAATRLEQGMRDAQAFSSR